MDNVFHPPRRAGAILHVLLIAGFLIVSAWFLDRASRTPIGPAFAGYLLAMMAMLLPIPVLGYRLYSLFRSSYAITDHSVRLRWGLRVEEIPVTEIRRVVGENKLELRLRPPLLSWPGAVLGVRRAGRGRPVEFMAARSSGLVFIDTGRTGFAISPEDPRAFLRAYRHVAEMGDFDPVIGRSLRPAALVGSAWVSPPARLLLALSALLAAGLAVWVIFVIEPQAGDRYPLGDTGRFVNSTLLFLLPVVNSFYFSFDLLLGLFFFRRDETRPLSYLLWLSSVLASTLFITAVFALV